MYNTGIALLVHLTLEGFVLQDDNIIIHSLSMAASRSTTFLEQTI